MQTLKAFFLVFLLFYALPALSQYFPSEVWHDGKVTLLSGEEIRGQVKYNLEGDLVQVNVNNTIQTYSARKLLFFEIFDETASRYRQFYALPYDVRPGYRVPILFEVLHENTVTLLARESVVQDNVPQYNYYSYYNYGNRFATRYRLEYDYYFLNQQGGIASYSQKKDDLHGALTQGLSRPSAANQQALEKYIKKNKLKVDRQRDLVRIVAYYNSLINA